MGFSAPELVRRALEIFRRPIGNFSRRLLHPPVQKEFPPKVVTDRQRRPYQSPLPDRKWCCPHRLRFEPGLSRGTPVHVFPDAPLEARSSFATPPSNSRPSLLAHNVRARARR